MNKDEEIDELDKFIKFLEASGPTYVGPWLRHQFPGIENAIRADFCPSIYNMSWNQWKQYLDEIKRKSDEERRIMLQFGKEDAQKIRDAAEKVRDQLWQTLRQVEKILEQA